MAQRRENLQPFMSSSWKMLQKESRSTSFPAVIQRRTPFLTPSSPPKGQVGDFSLSTEDEKTQSWAQALHNLAQTSVSSPTKKNRSGIHRKMMTVDLEASPRSPQRTPVLIMTLVRMHDVLEQFCSHLIDPTYANVQKACLVLDSTNAATTPKPSRPGSPASVLDSPSSHHTNRSNTSPSLSPITSWLIGSYATTTGYSESSLSRKREWEKFCNPLVLFAGLEAIYAACAHLEAPSSSSSSSSSLSLEEISRGQTLVLLYEKAMDGFRRIREVLCDPFITHVPDTESSFSPAKNTIVTNYREKAEVLGESIDALMVICKSRCKLIEEQIEIFDTEVLDTEKSIDSFQMILRSLPKAPADSESTLLVRSISQEIELWCDILRVYGSLGNLAFTKTIVYCQKLKLNLSRVSTTSPTETTYIYKWMHASYQTFVSLLPIYFDRWSSNVFSHYRFQKSSLRTKVVDTNSGSEQLVDLDWKDKMDEYLRAQDRGGNPLAIAIVADGSSFAITDSPFSRARSGIFSSTAGRDNTMQSEQFVSNSELAVSSYPVIYLASTLHTHSSSRSLGIRRNSGRKEGLDRHPQEKDDLYMDFISKMDVESWPYSSWNSLVQLLQRTTTSFTTLNESDDVEWSQIDSQTLVRASFIQEGMWLVALRKRKPTDESIWNMRSSIEENPWKEHQVLFDFSEALRLSGIFHLVPKIRRKDRNSGLYELEDILSDGNHSDTDDQLSVLIQEVLGLRSSSTFKYSFRTRKHSGRKRSSDARENAESYKEDTSHFAYFVGRALMDSI